ncbi:MAG: hypothetical protein HY858_04855 [Candidatus Solibacter usitatus]|nr:hypothetical protein [Candidatus Solibacter usitatus]
MEGSRLRIRAAAALLCATVAGWGQAATLTVGPQGRYSKPCQAFAAAQDGDLVEIDAAGDYTRDVCQFTKHNLRIRGVNGRPKIDAGGSNSQGKAVWVVSGDNNIIENVEILGAKVPDRNGAAIRFEGVNLTLRWVYFHDNENGVLSVGRGGDILVEYSEFDHNGDGSGATHNIYIGPERRLTIRFSYFHRAVIGHVVKSRASENYFYYNRFMCEDGDSSYEVDLPNGGTAVLVGNVIQQGPLTDNIHMLAYLEEGARPGYSNVLLMAHNTLVNEGPGDYEGLPANFIFTGKGVFQGLVANNIFAGPGVISNAEPESNLVFLNNLATQEALFASPSSGDYRLADGSPAIGSGQALPDEYAALLTPLWQHQPAACGQRRPQAMSPSPGAFEYGVTEPTISEPCVVYLETLQAKLWLASSKVTSAGSQSGYVVLDGIAPPGGAEVSLQYSHPAVLTGPARVTIPAGEQRARIDLSWSAPAEPVMITITAVYREQAADTRLEIAVPVTIPPRVNALVLSPAELTGGNTTSGNTVTLSRAAGAGGAVVSLSTPNPDIITVPATVLVPAGRSQVSFSVLTRIVGAAVQSSITASWNGTQATAPLKVNPVTLSHILVPGKRLGGPARHLGAVLLTGPAPASGMVIQLSSTAPEAFAPPAQAVVPAGSDRVNFDIQVAAVSTPVSGEIKAVQSGETKSAAVTADAFSISGLLLNPAITTGGLTSGVNRVTLNSPAPADGPMVVLLGSSNDAAARVPERVPVQPGLSTASFQVVTGKVNSITRVEIRAVLERPTAGIGEKTAVLMLRP